MSKQTEKAINGLHKFMEAHGGADSEEELQELLDQYMKEYNASLRFQPELSEATAKSSEDWLELAENADNPDDAIRFAEKALSLDPNNYDAFLFLNDANFELPHEQIEDLNKEIEKATRHMEEAGFIPDDVGEFWGVHGTRPYIRLLSTRMQLCKESGMLPQAIQDAEEILRLNSRDNTGARLHLMSMYCMLMEKEKAEALMERFSKDGYIETGLALPLSILYFRLGNFERAKEILLKLAAFNKDTKKFFRDVINHDLDKHFEKMPEAGYRPNTIDEFLVFMQDEYYLFVQSTAYLLWAEDVLKHSSGSKVKIRKKNKRH